MSKNKYSKPKNADRSFLPGNSFNQICHCEADFAMRGSEANAYCEQPDEGCEPAKSKTGSDSDEALLEDPTCTKSRFRQVEAIQKGLANLDALSNLSLAVPGKHLPQGHGASVAPWYKPMVCFVKDPSVYKLTAFAKGSCVRFASLTVPRSALAPACAGKRFPSLSLNLDTARKKSLAASLLSCPAAKAFSLVEMLMTLLVASLLMAALAPVMTRRFSENLSVAGATGGIIPKTFCAYVNDGTAPILKNAEDTACLVPENTFSANVILASGGGGGGGAADMAQPDNFETLISTSGADGAKTGSADVFANGEAAFDKSTKSITLKISGAGGSGGGGNYYETGYGAPKSQADCEPFGVYISAAQNGGKAICVSKYNPGENRDGSPDIPSKVGNVTINLVPAGTTCTYDTSNSANGASCCWYGNNDSNHPTSSDCSPDGESYGYNACYRTVCQWQAANAICKNWKPLGANGPSGRLPHKEELEAWKPHIDYNQNGNYTGVLNKYVSETSPGLRLCTFKRSNSNNYGNSWCYFGDTANTKCGNEYCLPYSIWTDNNDGDNAYARGNFDGSILHPSAKQPFYMALSPRCVIEETHTFTPQSGGGGGSGTYVEVEVPENIISLATSGGNAKIVTKAGAGAKGAKGAETGSTASADDGIKGSPSRVEIYSGSNLLWALTVPAGNGGFGAGKEKGGNPSAETSAKCVYYDSTVPEYQSLSGVSIDCSDLPTKISTQTGNPGITGDSVSSNKGAGGSSVWQTSSGTPTIGAGGAGGTCEAGENEGEATCPEAKSGKGGSIVALHKPAYPGIGGGGGGAGIVYYIKNIQVRPNDLIHAQIGHGGAGGSKNENGKNGGNSWIEVYPNGSNTLKARFEAVGGGGGGAGTQGVPASNIRPIPGSGGEGGKIIGSKPSNADIFPKNTDDLKGFGAPEPNEDEVTSPGGNGGINPHISPLAPTDGNLNGKPCGGLSFSPIIYNDVTIFECTNTAGNVPLPLKRALEDGFFTSEIIKNLAPGSTGGGGGGWKYGATPAASAGAKGMGGYVYIYFGEWGE